MVLIYTPKYHAQLWHAIWSVENCFVKLNDLIILKQVFLELKTGHYGAHVINGSSTRTNYKVGIGGAHSHT